MTNLPHRVYNKDTKRKGERNMKKVNLWKSEYTGQVYELPVDVLPQFGGWQLIATIEKED